MALPAIFGKKEKTDLSSDTFRNAFNEIDILEKVYLITWNPKPRFYNYQPFEENDYNLQWMTMIDVLCMADRCCSNYAFVPEISPEGKLHMHGWFIISDKVKYHKSFLPSLKRNGFIKKLPANSHGWKTFQYHVKDVQETVEYLTEFDNIVLTPDTTDSLKKRIRRYRTLCDKIDKPKKFAIQKQNVMLMIQNAYAIDLDDNKYLGDVI